MIFQPFVSHVPQDQGLVEGKVDILKSHELFSFFLEGYYRPFPTGYWIHRIVDGPNGYFGIVGLTDIEDLVNAKILPHEGTLVKKEQKAIAMIAEQKIYFKPILLVYEPHQLLDHLIIFWMRRNRIQFEITDSRGLVHQLWHIDDSKTIEQIHGLFKEINLAYLADGHHRVAAARTLHQKNQRYSKILSAYFSFESIRIYPYHRLIQSDLDLPELLPKLEQFCYVQNRKKPIIPGEGEVLLLVDQKMFLLKWKDAGEDISEAIDVALFNRVILRKIFRISDVRDCEEVTYADGSMSFDQIRNKMQKENSKIAFLFNPISATIFRELAQRKLMLPPKSTWFVPRMVAGLTTYKLND